MPARPRLSLARVLAVLALVAGVLVGAGIGVRRAVGYSKVSFAPTWFAPYVDVTLTPLYQFQDPTREPARQVVLGFVVADPHSPCSPTWGGYYGLTRAASSLNLDNRLAQLRGEGIGAIVSFGGQANTELAVSCTNTAELAAAYSSVITRYHVTTVDFDIEGAALGNWASVERRAAAVAVVQKSARSHGGELAVWLTLPVSPEGLDDAALSQVRAMLHAGDDIAGVNVMAMDYGHPVPDMAAAAESALTRTEGELAALFPRYGVRLSAGQLWHKLGVTVMIGQNDNGGEQFSVGDAAAVEAFAAHHRIARVSLWSLNRDGECGSYFGVVGVRSNSCSGVTQGPLQFDSTFATLSGSAAAVAGVVTPVSQPLVDTNPADAPYPIWQPNVPYVVGYKVVWQGEIYQSKWYNSGQDPAAAVQYSWQTPWQLIGPVLPGDHAPTTTTLAPGTYPAWAPTPTYRAGDKVLFQGLPYVAKWYNEGSSPAAAATDPSGSPWQALYQVPGEPSNTTAG